jgi:hypothetical protein
MSKLDHLLWRMHEGGMNEAAILSYPCVVGLAAVGLAGIGSYHTDCQLLYSKHWRCCTVQYWGYQGR